MRLMEKKILGAFVEGSDKKLPESSYMDQTTAANDLVDLESFMQLDEDVTDDDPFDKYMTGNGADIDDVFAIFESDEVLFDTNNNTENVVNSGREAEYSLFEGSGDGDDLESTTPASRGRNRDPNQLIDFMESNSDEDEDEDATRRTYSVVVSTNTSTTSVNVAHSNSSNEEDIFADTEPTTTSAGLMENESQDNLAENGISVKDLSEISSLLAENSQAIQFDDTDEEALYESDGFIDSHSIKKPHQEDIVVITEKEEESEPPRLNTYLNGLSVNAATTIIDFDETEEQPTSTSSTTELEVTEQVTQTTTDIFEVSTEILDRSEHVVDSFTTPSPDDSLITLPTSSLNDVQAEIGNSLDETTEFKMPDHFKDRYPSVVSLPTEEVTVLSSVDIFSAVKNNGTLSVSRELTPSEVESIYNRKIEENESVEEADEDDSEITGLTLDKDTVWDDLTEEVEPSTEVPEVKKIIEPVETERESKELKHDTVSYLNTTILNHSANFSVQISRQLYSIYIPSTAYVRQYSDIVNITWRLNENMNNSLALKVHEKDHSYVIKEFLLNILLDNYYIVQKKHIRVTANLHELMEPVEVKLRDDVVVTFSNVGFLRKPIKKGITEYTMKEQRVWGIQIASICIVALLLASLTFYIILKRKSRASLREKADIPQIHHC
ncbi:uncharacterized protein LOC143190667 isoform X2 [Rhynchophorus ferrugineus]